MPRRGRARDLASREISACGGDIETFDKRQSFPADVDECSVPDLQTELCRYGCINTPGSYRCAEPMELKDQPVLDSLSITCLPGYEQTSHGTCIGESVSSNV